MHTPHMSPDEFRKYGKEIIDWIADYYEQIESFPVLSRSKPGEVRKGLPDSPPLEGESIADIMKDVDNVLLPGITHWQSPGFFAYFPSNTSGPSILGDLLSSGLGVQGMLWATSPACTELETHVMDWLVDMMALPERFKSTSTGGGVIQDTASSAALTAILAAREKYTGFESNRLGAKQNFVAYVSDQAHSSLEKAIKIAGIGASNLRKVPVDHHYAMKPTELRKRIRDDRKRGLEPFFVCATVGTTSSNAMDPLADIGKVCLEEHVWFHVDGAMSGTAALCPEFRGFLEGLEYADSYCFNPHKWMFTNFDCDCFYVADREVLIRTLSILPDYLKNKATESGAVFDYRDWHIPLGRRFRSLKLWFVIRYYGIEGLQTAIRHHVELAREFTHWVEGSEIFELAAPVPLNLVCFRHKNGNDFNKVLMDTVNREGKLFLSHTVLDDMFTLRMSIGQTNTRRVHVEKAWMALNEAAARLSNDSIS